MTQPTRKLFVDFDHVLNEKPHEYLRGRRGNYAPFSLPDNLKDCYLNQGSHPDVVERLWDQIGKALPVDGRCLVYGAPALVHAEKGIVIGICGGTVYYLRLGPVERAAAIKNGAEIKVVSSLGDVFDVAANLGPDWVCAEWDKNEVDWVIKNYEELEKLK